MIEEPRTPALPTRSPIAVCFVGLLAAVVSSAGLCFAADYADPTFRNPAEVADLLGIPVLATLPSADRALSAGEMQS
jgi:capsular polysaccharide biosynthesis protein